MAPNPVESDEFLAPGSTLVPARISGRAQNDLLVLGADGGVTVAFILLHGLRPGLLLGVAPAALLYLWLRARTGSLAPPIAAHVLWNGSVLALHA